jgi:hypothetical protein
VIHVSGASFLSMLGARGLRHPEATIMDKTSKHKTTRTPKRIRAPQERPVM